MNLLLLSVHHRVHGLEAVEQTQSVADELTAALRATGHVRGELELATCNRWELYLDVEAGRAGDVAHALVHAVAAAEVTLPADVVHATQTDALWHLFQVAAGLDSMVLGEREIAGQLRRAQSVARSAGRLSGELDTAVTHALRTARRIQGETGLAATGRSIVAVALELAAVDTTRPVVVVGTGAYAGAAVTALRRLGVDDIVVHSVSGRGEQFARSHHTGVAADLAAALAAAGAVVCCHGGGTVITPDLLPADAVMAVVDLALSHDVDPACRALPGVRLVDLGDVQAAAPQLAEAELGAARRLVAGGLAGLVDALNERRVAPAAAALQQVVQAAVEDEISRLPAHLAADDAATHALRRLAARLVHVPLTRAREAAREGRADEYLASMVSLLGIDAEIGLPEEPLVLDPATFETQRCPVTGMAIDDLAPVPRRT